MTSNQRITLFKGTEIFSTDYIVQLRYNLSMAIVDDDTKILEDHTSKNIDNFSVKVNEDESFELWLFHARKITANHVDEAEIVGTWKFNSLKQLEYMKELVETSIKNQLKR